MRFNEYQERTASTAIYPNKVKFVNEIAYLENNNYSNAAEILRNVGTYYCGLGLGEAGEVQGKIKKILRDSGGVITEETKQKLKEELGDILWYISQLATELGLNLSDIALENLAKLQSRKERGQLKGSGDER